MEVVVAVVVVVVVVVAILVVVVLVLVPAPRYPSLQPVESSHPACCQVRHWAEKRGGLGAKNVQFSLGLAIFQRFPLNLADAFSKGGA